MMMSQNMAWDLTALLQDLRARRLNLSNAFFFFCQKESGSTMMPSSPTLFSDSLVSLAATTQVNILARSTAEVFSPYQ